jgi:hypothetical protein
MRRMKRAPLTTNQWIDRVKTRQIYNCGDRFSSAHMASAMDCDSNNALRILVVMADRGLVNVTKEKKGGAHMYWYTKSKTSIDPIRIPWRKHPNYHPMPSRWAIGMPI